MSELVPMLAAPPTFVQFGIWYENLLLEWRGNASVLP
jgi:hypothetical protein